MKKLWQKLLLVYMKCIQNKEKQFSTDFQSEKKSKKKLVLVEKMSLNWSTIVQY